MTIAIRILGKDPDVAPFGGNGKLIVSYGKIENITFLSAGKNAQKETFPVFEMYEFVRKALQEIPKVL